jgi:DNA polymerase III subunit epsilon
MLARLSLRARIFLFFLMLGLGSLAALCAGLWFALHRGADEEAIAVSIRVATVSGFLILALTTGIGYLFDLHLAKALEKLAGAIRARASAGVAQEIDTTDLLYLGSITEAVSEAAMKLTQTRNALAETVARETARLSADKTHLEHILSDVPPGVLLCTGRHHLVFYNGAAQNLLDHPALPLCLDKNLFDYLNDGPIRHAHQRLVETGTAAAAMELVCTTHGHTRRLAARMRLVGEGSADPAAYVMTLRDVTVAMRCSRKSSIRSYRRSIPRQSSWRQRLSMIPQPVWHRFARHSPDFRPASRRCARIASRGFRCCSRCPTASSSMISSFWRACRRKRSVMRGWMT